MLCSPRAAQRCLESFDGTAVIMPNTFTFTEIPKYDCTPPRINVLSYYMLVLISLTGLSTMLKFTKFKCSKENINKPVDGPIASISDKELVADESVWAYIREQSQTQDLILQRRFEFEFFGGLSIVMLHLTCQKNLLHMVEIYRVKNKVLRMLATAAFDIAYFLSRTMALFIPKKQKQQ